jgi:hypothetical protein
MKHHSLIVGFSVATLVSGFALAHGGGGHGGKRHMDTNKDGKITLDEALAGAKTRFAKVDANKDGSITKDEAKGPFAHKLEKKDTNKDGKLTLAEMEAGVRTWFQTADKNKDSVLTGDEMRMGHGGRGGDCGHKGGKGKA